VSKRPLPPPVNPAGLLPSLLQVLFILEWFPFLFFRTDMILCFHRTFFCFLGAYALPAFICNRRVARNGSTVRESALASEVAHLVFPVCFFPLFPAQRDQNTVQILFPRHPSRANYPPSDFTRPQFNGSLFFPSLAGRVSSSSGQRNHSKF